MEPKVSKYWHHISCIGFFLIERCFGTLLPPSRHSGSRPTAKPVSDGHCASDWVEPFLNPFVQDVNPSKATEEELAANGNAYKEDLGHPKMLSTEQYKALEDFFLDATRGSADEKNAAGLYSLCMPPALGISAITVITL